MSELSIFCDESGGMGGMSKYRIVTLVFHDQSQEIDTQIEAYESDLTRKGLPDLPFHTGPLMYRKMPYNALDLDTRKRMLSAFSYFQGRLPFQYHSFVYERSDFAGEHTFMARLRRDLVVFLADNLEYFQSFDQIKIYYDNAQQTISSALHAALEYEISRQALMYKDATPASYRLIQVADFICSIELVALKFDNSELTSTDKKFFNSSSPKFKKNYLRKIRKKLL